MTAESVIAKIETAGGVFRLTPRGVAVVGVSSSLRSEAKPYRSAIETVLRARVSAARMELVALAECWRRDCLAYSAGDDSQYARMGPTSARVGDLVDALMTLDPGGGYLAVKARMDAQAAAAEAGWRLQMGDTVLGTLSHRRPAHVGVQNALNPAVNGVRLRYART